MFNPVRFLNHVYIEAFSLVENPIITKGGLPMDKKTKTITNVKIEEKKRESEEPIYLLRC